MPVSQKSRQLKKKKDNPTSGDLGDEMRVNEDPPRSNDTDRQGQEPNPSTTAPPSSTDNSGQLGPDLVTPAAVQSEEPEIPKASSHKPDDASDEGHTQGRRWFPLGVCRVGWIDGVLKLVHY